MISNFIQSIIRFRVWIVTLTLLITLLAGFFTTNLRIVIDPMAILPASHPFVSSKTQLENIFSEHYSFVVAIEPKSGNALDPVVLQKIQRITTELKKDSSLVKSTLLSVASQNAKAILDNGGESFEVRPLHTVLNQPEKLRAWLDSNPIYRNAIVSPDYKTFTVLAQFKPDPQGYGAILKRIQPIVDKERDENVNIYLSGHVNFLGQIELYSERMVILVPIAIVLIALSTSSERPRRSGRGCKRLNSSCFIVHTLLESFPIATRGRLGSLYDGNLVLGFKITISKNQAISVKS